MVKESLIPILKVTSCHVVIPLGRNFVARRYLRDWNHAGGIDHRYSDALSEKGFLRPSCRDETRHLRWQKDDGILFRMVTSASGRWFPVPDIYEEGGENHVLCMQTAETRTSAWTPSERKVLLVEPVLQRRPFPTLCCQLRAARRQPLRRTRQTSCYSAALRPHLWLPNLL